MGLDGVIKKFESDKFYYSDYEFVTNSHLGTIKRDIRTYKFLRDNPNDRVETMPMVFGRAYHVAMLEPNEFDKKVKVCNSATRTTKMFREFKADNPNAPTILLTKEYDKIMKMQEVLFKHKQVKDLLTTDGITEVANAWQDDDIGVYCKGKADYKNKNVLIDLKTTIDSSPYGFSQSCKKYGYDRQASFYMDGFNCDEFIFIVQEKEPPFNVSIYYTSDNFLTQGRDEYKHLLDVYRKYFIDNEYSLDDYVIIETL